MRKNKNRLEIEEFLFSSYQWIIPAIVTIIIAGIAMKLDIYPWEGEAYTDMLTALITFQSIIISVFGVLIPILITSKKEGTLAKYFFENADTGEFVKRIRRTIVSGILDILLLCALYSYDILPINIYIPIGITCLFVLLYFMCGSYRYINIMLRLLIGNDKTYKGKMMKSKIQEEQREEMNRRLKKRAGTQ